MQFHFIIGFLLPWIVLGVYLIKKQRKLFIAHYPISALISFFINDIGFSYFWRFRHFKEFTIAVLPYNIGIFPILGCLFIYLVYLNKIPSMIIFFLLVVFTTIAEFLMVLLKVIIYEDGWNIAWTAVSYSIAYIAVYLYYKLAYKLFS